MVASNSNCLSVSFFPFQRRWYVAPVVLSVAVFSLANVGWTADNAVTSDNNCEYVRRESCMQRARKRHGSVMAHHGGTAPPARAAHSSRRGGSRQPFVHSSTGHRVSRLYKASARAGSILG